MVHGFLATSASPRSAIFWPTLCRVSECAGPMVRPDHGVAACIVAPIRRAGGLYQRQPRHSIGADLLNLDKLQGWARGRFHREQEHSTASF